MVILYILLFILVLGLVVCIHELGHFFFAKKSGILVNEFAFGMGPKLYSKKKGETTWSIRMLPIGGFCAMSGEEATNPLVKVGDKVRLAFDDSHSVERIIVDIENQDYKDLELVNIDKLDLWGENMADLYINDYKVNRNAMVVLSKKEELQIAPEERSFASKKAWQRFLVCLGGPLNNILLAIVVFMLMSFLVGVADTSSRVVTGITEDSPAYVAGLRDNDELIKIGDYELTDYYSIGTAIHGIPSRALDVTYKRDGVTYTATVYASYAFQNLGFSSTSDTTEKVYITVETSAALGGTNKTKAYQDGGLRNGDEVTGLIYNDVTYPITCWNDVYHLANDVVDGGTVQLIYSREAEEGIISSAYEVYSDELLLSQGYEACYKLIGVSATTHVEFFTCIGNGFKYFGKAAGVIFSTLWLLVSSKEVGVNDMGGFITILNQTASYAAGGFTSLLYFIGLLSVNLGILNLLPIPALDGGKILFIGIEAITKKKINPKVQTIVENVVFWLLMAFIAYVFLQDIFRLIIQLK